MATRFYWNQVERQRALIRKALRKNADVVAYRRRARKELRKLAARRRKRAFAVLRAVLLFLVAPISCSFLCYVFFRMGQHDVFCEYLDEFDRVHEQLKHAEEVTFAEHDRAEALWNEYGAPRYMADSCFNVSVAMCNAGDMCVDSFSPKLHDLPTPQQLEQLFHLASRAERNHVSCLVDDQNTVPSITNVSSDGLLQHTWTMDCMALYDTRKVEVWSDFVEHPNSNFLRYFYYLRNHPGAVKGLIECIEKPNVLSLSDRTSFLTWYLPYMSPEQRLALLRNLYEFYSVALNGGDGQGPILRIKSRIGAIWSTYRVSLIVRKSVCEHSNGTTSSLGFDGGAYTMPNAEWLAASPLDFLRQPGTDAILRFRMNCELECQPIWQSTFGTLVIPLVIEGDANGVRISGDATSSP